MYIYLFPLGGKERGRPLHQCCREGICGSCAMNMNGENWLACLQKVGPVIALQYDVLVWARLASMAVLALQQLQMCAPWHPSGAVPCRSSSSFFWQKAASCGTKLPAVARSCQLWQEAAS